MKKALSSLLCIFVLVTGILSIGVLAAEDVKLDFTAADADISMMSTGEFHWCWMLVGDPNGADGYHFASTNNPAAQVDFCISVLPDKVSIDFSDYSTLRIHWLTSAPAGLTNVIEIAGDTQESYAVEITSESVILDPTDIGSIGLDGFTVTDLDIRGLEGAMTTLKIYPYYDDINLHPYYFYIQAIEFLTESSDDAVSPETLPEVTTAEETDPSEEVTSKDEVTDSEATKVENDDSTSTRAPETTPENKADGGVNPLIPIIIVAVVVVVAVVVIVIVRKKKSKLG